MVNRRLLATSYTSVTLIQLRQTTCSRGATLSDFLLDAVKMTYTDSLTKGEHIKPIAIAPSILDSDLANIESTLQMLENAGIRYAHIDVMDGQFVPNISFGVPVLASIRKSTDLILDVHLMIASPERFVESFAEAGADILTVHPESTPHIHRVLQQIRSLGLKSGLALNPGTPIDVATNLLEECDLILIMSVNPGFGGQQFQSTTYRRLDQLMQAIEASRYEIQIEVDGGVGVSNIRQLQEAGVDIAVIGSGIFSSDITPSEAIGRLQAIVGPS